MHLLDQYGAKLFHIHTAANHSQWIIYSYFASTGGFEGQATVTAMHETTTKHVFTVEGPLYLKANVSIAWDKYHGVICLYEKAPSGEPQGIVSKDPLVRIEEIKSIVPQYQSFSNSSVPQELCVYWVHERTAKTDRTKMHLAKGTDMALHCILAVITNMVHVERQADDS